MAAMDDQNDEKKRRLFSYIEIITIILLSLVPLFYQFPLPGKHLLILGRGLPHEPRPGAV